MPSLQNLSEIFIYLFISTLAFWSIKYLATVIHLFHQKQNITRHQAKLAMLRMSLKKTLRKKSNQIDTIVGLEPHSIRKMKGIYEQLFELDFGNNGSYQLLLNGLKEISDVIADTQFGMDDKMNRINSAGSDLTPTYNQENNFENIHFWQRLYETEYHIITCVFDTINTQSEIHHLIKKYNLMVRASDKYEQLPEPIKVEHFNLLDQVMHEKSLYEPVCVAA